MSIRTEALFTKREGFGVETASPVQRAIARILDGRPLEGLAEHQDVISTLGGREAVAMYEPGHPPKEVVLLAGIRGGKTLLTCAAALRSALTVDVSTLKPGEIPRVSIVSLTLDASAVAFRLLLETIKASATLRPLLHSETSDSLMIRQPTGGLVEIKVVAGSKAGGSLVARWSAGVIFDEAPRMGSGDSVVNLEDMRAAVLGRILPGAQLFFVGSPWAPAGFCWEAVQEFFGHPQKDFVVLRASARALNPIFWTQEREDELRRSNPGAAVTDLDGEFCDPESGLLSAASIRAAQRRSPLVLPPEPSAEYRVALDPSEGLAGGNGFTAAVVQVGSDKHRVCGVWEWRGLPILEIWDQLAKTVAPYSRQVVSDQYAATASQALGMRVGLQVTLSKTSASSKLDAFVNLQTMINSGRLELPACPVLERDLLLVKKRATQTGSSIHLPRTSDGRHADRAAALALALSGVEDRSGSMLTALSGKNWHSTIGAIASYRRGY